MAPTCRKSSVINNKWFKFYFTINICPLYQLYCLLFQEPLIYEVAIIGILLWDVADVSFFAVEKASKSNINNENDWNDQKKLSSTIMGCNNKTSRVSPIL